jgi:hypothetical protein
MPLIALLHIAQVRPVACKVAFENWASDDTAERAVININNSFFITICSTVIYQISCSNLYRRGLL